MQRLTGLDASFLALETPRTAMHVAGLAIYDPTGRPDWNIEEIRRMVAARLHMAPPFRRRLAEVPFGLHHPLWIEDPDFDLNWHLRHIAVPSPGGTAELSKLVGQLVAIPLDRTRPLWEMWIIEGLEGGRLATLTKVHHAAIDGQAGNELTVALFDLTPEIAEVPPPAEPWKPDKVPSDVELWAYALNSLARQPVRVAKATGRTAAMALSLRSTNRRRETSPPPAPFSAPRTSMNGSLTADRTYAIRTLSLTDVKRVKNVFGTTVNDVVLALCAGALRGYFDARREELDGPLVAMVPMSVRAEEEKGAGGNRVTSMLTSLATDVDDPAERLLSIHGAMKAAKEQTNAIGADMLGDWTEFAAPAVFSRAVRLYSRTRMADRHRPLFNVTISNVPGPSFPLYSAGARLVANYPVGPIMEGGGLNMTVLSYQDNLDFGLLACPALVDDVESIGDGLGAALDELLEAARVLDEAGTPKPARIARASVRSSAKAAQVGGKSSAKPASRAKASSAAKGSSAPDGSAGANGTRRAKSSSNGKAPKAAKAARKRAATPAASSSDS